MKIWYLLTALAVVCLLAIVSLRRMQRPTHANHQVDLKAISVLSCVLDVYMIDHGRYPRRLSDLCDRSPGGGYYYSPSDFPVDPWGEPFYYRKQANGGYILISCGADRTLFTGDDMAVSNDLPAVLSVNPLARPNGADVMSVFLYKWSVGGWTHLLRRGKSDLSPVERTNLLRNAGLEAYQGCC
jgi:hypothetical protein